MTIRSALILGTAVTGALLITGCGETRSDPVASPTAPPPTAQAATVNAPPAAAVTYPEWVLDPFTGGVFGATGISRASLGGTGEEMARALANGRTELARTIQVKVQSSYTRFFTEGGDIANKAGGGVEYRQMAQEMSENVSRQLTNQVISGSRQKQMWRDPSNKDLYIWVVIDNEKLAALNTSIKDEAKRQLDARAQVGAELKAADALKRLDAAIDAELARKEVPAPKPAAQ